MSAQQDRFGSGYLHQRIEPGIDERMQALTGRGCACHSSKQRLN
jgi:hypothetical protein